MRVLPYVVLLGAAIAGYIWAVQWVKDRSARRLAAAPPAPPLPPAAVWPDESATMVFGSDQGPGRLRLNLTQLVFTADSGRVLAIERLDIVGVAASRDVPDRQLVQEVLVITTASDSYYFMVASPRQWERWLTDGG